MNTRSCGEEGGDGRCADAGARIKEKKKAAAGDEGGVRTHRRLPIDAECSDGGGSGLGG